jgi:hypothetical protein
MVCLDDHCIWITTDELTHLMLRSSTSPRPAISKFRNVCAQIERVIWKMSLLWRLGDIAIHFSRDITDTRNQHRLIEEIREIALWFGPTSQLGWWKRRLYRYMLHVPAEWREQVEGLVVALKA